MRCYHTNASGFLRQTYFFYGLSSSHMPGRNKVPFIIMMHHKYWTRQSLFNFKNKLTYDWQLVNYIGQDFAINSWANIQ